MEIYIARAGDSPRSVARRFDIGVDALCALNQLRDPSRLTAGLSLAIPDEGAGAATGMEVAASAWPSITGESLGESIPYLSYLCPFSCAVSAGGELGEPPDGGMLQAAAEAGTAVLLTVTNIAPGGAFSGDIAHSLFADAAAQDVFFDNLLEALDNGGYYGANLSFQYVYPYDRDGYSGFVRRAADVLHERGYFLFTTLAPKSGGQKQGIPDFAHDYVAHGGCADRVALMTYEWGYSCSKPQAVSPVNRIRAVLDYAVGEMPRGKILMGLSNCGYDWRLPWRSGEAARPLSNAAAANLAISAGAEVLYDRDAQAAYFNYTDAAGLRHQVWYEDGRSVLARLALAEEYGLAGVSLWTINQLYRPMLEALRAGVEVERVK